MPHGGTSIVALPSAANGFILRSNTREATMPDGVARAKADDRPDALYARLEERILDRDQVGALDTYHQLFRAGRPLTEMLAEAVRIHGPYTHVPYHERIDDGYVNFVNNDHCLLSARHLAPRPARAGGLPPAQTIWYIPPA